MRPLFLLAWSACTSVLCAQTPVTHDVVVYGDSAAAVAAAIQAKRQGLDVVLVNSTDFLGGMTCSGLSASDIFHREAVGGVARELYGRIGQHYGKAYVDYFEPHVAQAAMDGMVKDAGVKVFLNEQLDRSAGGVSKEGTQLKSFRTLSGKVFVAKVFIDASYVGDLMAAAGVSYAVGREPNTLFTETLNGAQRGDNKPRKHYTQKDKDHFIKDVDPYVKAGDPASGLLPFVFAEDPVTGEGDRRIQAYNYRLCVTTDPANRLPFTKPEGYRELDHEMLLRNLEAGDVRFPALLHKLPNGKPTGTPCMPWARTMWAPTGPTRSRLRDAAENRASPRALYSRPPLDAREPSPRPSGDPHAGRRLWTLQRRVPDPRWLLAHDLYSRGPAPPRGLCHDRAGL
ncbi:hypothetical protein EMGBS8_05420 [Verrucomicrobiota bacterium]|nr:hypothetical protein EMGBS8_05420 [Verrucomicrobiota bacterium]